MDLGNISPFAATVPCSPLPAALLSPSEKRKLEEDEALAGMPTKKKPNIQEGGIPSSGDARNEKPAVTTTDGRFRIILLPARRVTTEQENIMKLKEERDRLKDENAALLERLQLFHSLFKDKERLQAVVSRLYPQQQK